MPEKSTTPHSPQTICCQSTARPNTTNHTNIKSQIPVLKDKYDYHSKCSKPSNMCTSIALKKTNIPSEKPKKDKNHQQPDWMKWRIIMTKNGMVSAANAISDALCGQCDRQDREDRKSNRNFVDLEAIEGSGYNGKAMDMFSKKTIHDRLEQFGRWPRVYEKMPSLKVVIKESTEYVN